MKFKIFILNVFLLNFLNDVQGQPETKFELSNGLETVTYHEGITWFYNLSKKFSTINFQEVGETDSGLPLHLVTFSADEDFDFRSLKNKKKSIILVNNAIHPGEPDGVDASMLLLRDLASDKNALIKFKDIVLIVIPFYNVGGALNRNSTTRVNQNGPRAYGFRGNAQNLDLNRDFIKLDSRNAKTFTQIYHLIDPDIFVDNHVSNGADYQYVMTMLETQPDKLGGAMGHYLKNQLMPKLENQMVKMNFEMIPYVNVFNTTPDSGYIQFLDGPRYSSGYTTLFHSIGFVPETHMLKPYKQRVAATHAFLLSLLNIVKDDGPLIQELRDKTKLAVQNQKEFVIEWQLDKTSFRNLKFKGYEGIEVESKTTGQKRLFYDRNKPFEKLIPFYNLYIPKTKILKPEAYIVPRGWHQVIERLKLNEVAMEMLENDTVVTLEVYHIEDYKTVTTPYEGHYLHYETKVQARRMPVQLFKDDFIIYTNQVANRYLIETLEPTAPDSFFNWNFFDTILKQKEGYSDYVFEDLAIKILQEDQQLKERFEQKKINDPDFAKDGKAQLDYIYINSPHYEKAYLRYPVFRLVEH